MILAAQRKYCDNLRQKICSLTTEANRKFDKLGLAPPPILYGSQSFLRLATICVTHTVSLLGLAAPQACSFSVRDKNFKKVKDVFRCSIKKKNPKPSKEDKKNIAKISMINLIDLETSSVHVSTTYYNIHSSNSCCKNV